MNRLTKRAYPDTTTVNYTYDNGSRLTQVSDPTGTYQFTFDNMGRLTNTTTSYAFLSGRNFTTSYAYDSFGKLTASTGSLVNPFQYTARESDTETGLYYYRARHYDSGAGRFLSEDPVRFTGGINFYAYARNRPANIVDPFGLWPSLGGIWDKAKGAWDKGKAYAGKIGCLSTYWLCVAVTVDNLYSISQASQGMPRYTPDDLANPSQNEGASHGAHQIKQCISGNKNCDKDLEDCLAGLLSGGILPH